jgi:outer membrane receptor for ferrienterochelin and colicins
MLRDEATDAVTSWRDAYGRVDVRLAHRLPGGFELVGGADNLFDQQPAEWAGFTGRHLYTALSWALDREDHR